MKTFGGGFGCKNNEKIKKKRKRSSVVVFCMGEGCWLPWQREVGKRYGLP